MRLSEIRQFQFEIPGKENALDLLRSKWFVDQIVIPNIEFIITQLDFGSLFDEWPIYATLIFSN